MTRKFVIIPTLLSYNIVLTLHCDGATILWSSSGQYLCTFLKKRNSQEENGEKGIEGFVVKRVAK